MLDKILATSPPQSLSQTEALLWQNVFNLTLVVNGLKTRVEQLENRLNHPPIIMSPQEPPFGGGTTG